MAPGVPVGSRKERSRRAPAVTAEGGHDDHGRFTTAGKNHMPAPLQDGRRFQHPQASAAVPTAPLSA